MPGTGDSSGYMAVPLPVHALNISVNEIDMETMGTVIAIEGTKINVDQLITAIEDTGSVVHSIDEIATGTRILGSVQTRQ